MHEINVKMGEIELTTKAGVVLVTSGLGSCIGLAVYDKKSRMAGMAHIVLPASNTVSTENIDDKQGKYANIAVPSLLEKMLSLGSKKEDLIIKIVGGAQMFNFKNSSSALNIGRRNIIAVKNAVEDIGLCIHKSHTGGNKGRTFSLNVLNGTFYLKITSQKEIEF